MFCDRLKILQLDVTSDKDLEEAHSVIKTEIGEEGKTCCNA